MSHLTPPFIIAMLIALTVHEWAHGYTAYLLGDNTAKYQGRLTFNPLAHLDLLGTLLFLTVGFGWAKPVPIDPRAFRHPKRDTTLTALAGPASNLLLILFTVGVLVLIPSFDPIGWERFLGEFLSEMLRLNLILMAFNLLPIAPLDGSKVLGVFIPLRYEETYEKYLRNGPIILLALLFAEWFLGIPLISSWMSLVMEPVLRVMEVML